MIEVSTSEGICLVDPEAPLSVDELVFLTGHARNYFAAMKRCGFPLKRRPGERIQTATYGDYLRFFRDNPDFRFRKAYPAR